MASTLKVYPNGLTAGIRPTKRVAPGLRGDVKGWSLNSSRSNTHFLYSVRVPDLTGFGLALTLTVRDCPETHEDWKRAREALLAYMRRLGAIRVHWLTEWQRRKVPHLHGVAWFPDPGSDLERQRLALLIKAAWLRISAPYRSAQQSQTVKPLTGELGWLEYLAKHAARGAAHYQRAAEGIPPGWQKTGRMWGYTGDWPIDEPIGVTIEDWPSWFRLRRLVRSYRVAKARSAGRHPREIRAIRRMLRCTDPQVAHYRGVYGWVPQVVTLAMLDWLARCGAEMTC